MKMNKDIVPAMLANNKLVKNEIGNRYARLVVLERNKENSSNGSAKWICLCDCGEKVVVIGKDLRQGKSKSCGCWTKDRLTKHGKTNSSEFKTWGSMKSRCLNSTDKDYKNYGGRGIKVCNRWLESFENFMVDMGEKPGNEYSIERIDNEGNYEPGNCKWATIGEQNRNKRTVYKLTFNGETKTLKEWSADLDIPVTTLMNRIKQNWTIERMLSEPKHTEINSTNQRKPHKGNTSGYLGVCVHKATNKYQAQIQVNKKMKHLGIFDNPIDAYEAYKKAKRIYHNINL